MGKLVVVLYAIIGMLTWIGFLFWLILGLPLLSEKLLKWFHGMLRQLMGLVRRIIGLLWRPEYVVPGIAVFAFILFVLLFFNGINAKETDKFSTTFAPNLATDFLSIAITILVIDQANRWRDKVYQQRLEEHLAAERKREILEQMGSQVNDVALEAVRIARKHGWLNDGSLKKINLMGANLRGAELYNADLREANLLTANLQNAKLMFAKLQGSNLWGARLQNANLNSAKLQKAILDNAFLQDANFEETDLTTTKVKHAQYSVETTWPKGFDYIGAGAVLDYVEEVPRAILILYTSVGWARHIILREDTTNGGRVFALEVGRGGLLAFTDYPAVTERQYAGIPGRTVEEGIFTVFDVLYEASPPHLRYKAPDPIAYGKLLMLGLFRPPAGSRLG